MSIDEAIKHCEEVMVENLEKTKDRNSADPVAIQCFECADEHRQLAEWLKELKAIKEDGDCISRQAAIDAIEEDKRNGNDSCFASNYDAQCFKQIIKELPPVKPEKKAGHWIREEHPDAMPTFTVTWRCSVCGKDQSYGEPPFCPNCGHPMERQA